LALCEAQKRKLLCGDEICSITGSPDFLGTGWQSPKKFCLNDKPLDRVTLGHVSWSFLHTTAAYLPETMNQTQIDAFQNLIWAVRDIYACELCRGHFQTLMQDPNLQRELKAVSTRMQAVLFVWKIHNMVTAKQYPNNPLFMKGVSATYAPKQTQNFTIQNGQEVYENITEESATASLHTLFTPGANEIPLNELASTFQGEAYDGIIQRWRAEGGLVPVPSLYAAQPMPASQIKIWKENMNLADTWPPSPKGICKAVFKQVKALQGTANMSTVCPRPVPQGKIDIAVFTMARCPFCAMTMMSLKPILAGSLADKISVKDRYVLMAATNTPTSLNDFSSAHGPGEVLGDAFELCVEQHYPTQWIKWVWCVDKQYYAVGTENNTETCASELGFNYTLLKSCATGAEGLRLLEGTAALSKRMNINSAPGIVINGKLLEISQQLPSSWESIICTELACQDLTPTLFPDSDVNADSSESSTTYLAAQSDDDFAPPTAMFSDAHQKVYQNLLQGMLGDGEVTAEERQMLANTRRELGITKTDHANALALSGGHLGVDSDSDDDGDNEQVLDVLAVLGVVGVVVAVVAGVWYRSSQMNEPNGEVQHLRIALDEQYGSSKAAQGLVSDSERTINL